MIACAPCRIITCWERALASLQALEAIEQAIKDKASRAELAKLCSTFYTIIPHAFGRMVPPVIADAESLQKKFDMLLVLGDIELAQGMQQGQEKKEQKVLLRRGSERENMGGGSLGWGEKVVGVIECDWNVIGMWIEHFELPLAVCSHILRCLCKPFGQNYLIGVNWGVSYVITTEDGKPIECNCSNVELVPLSVGEVIIGD